MRGGGDDDEIASIPPDVPLLERREKPVLAFTVSLSVSLLRPFSFVSSRHGRRHACCDDLLLVLLLLLLLLLLLSAVTLSFSLPAPLRHETISAHNVARQASETVSRSADPSDPWDHSVFQRSSAMFLRSRLIGNDCSNR